MAVGKINRIQVRAHTRSVKATHSAYGKETAAGKPTKTNAGPPPSMGWPQTNKKSWAKPKMGSDNPRLSTGYIGKK